MQGWCDQTQKSSGEINCMYFYTCLCGTSVACFYGTNAPTDSKPDLEKGRGFISRTSLHSCTELLCFFSLFIYAIISFCSLRVLRYSCAKHAVKVWVCVCITPLPLSPLTSCDETGDEVKLSNKSISPLQTLRRGFVHRLNAVFNWQIMWPSLFGGL